MKKCKYCKTEIDKKAKVCPQCGKKQSSPVKALLAIIVVVIVAIVAIASIGGGDEQGAAKNTGDGNPYEAKQVILEAENIKVTFVKAYEEDYIDGAFYFQLEAENGFDERVWIACEDAEVNGYSTLVMSGVPLEVNAGAKGKNAFFINEDNVNLEDLEDLETMKFKIVVYEEESMTRLYTSDEIVINFK